MNLQTLRTDWQKTKDWFHNSESIFIARMETAVGFFIAAVDGMDWSSLLSLDFTNALASKQALAVGVLVMFKGIVSEWARRRNDPMFQPKPVEVTQ